MGSAHGDHEHHHHEEIAARLSRIEGHVRGVRAMLEVGKPCDQVLVQMSAIRGAIDSASQLLMEDHFDHCIVAHIEKPEVRAAAQEFRKALGQLLR